MERKYGGTYRRTGEIFFLCSYPWHMLIAPDLPTAQSGYILYNAPLCSCWLRRSNGCNAARELRKITVRCILKDFENIGTDNSAVLESAGFRLCGIILYNCHRCRFHTVFHNLWNPSLIRTAVFTCRTVLAGTCIYEPLQRNSPFVEFP